MAQQQQEEKFDLHLDERPNCIEGTTLKISRRRADQASEGQGQIVSLKY